MHTSTPHTASELSLLAQAIAAGGAMDMGIGGIGESMGLGGGLYGSPLTIGGSIPGGASNMQNLWQAAQGGSGATSAGGGMDWWTDLGLDAIDVGEGFRGRDDSSVGAGDLSC